MGIIVHGLVHDGGNTLRTRNRSEDQNACLIFPQTHTYSAGPDQQLLCTDPEHQLSGVCRTWGSTVHTQNLFASETFAKRWEVVFKQQYRDWHREVHAEQVSAL